MLRTGKYQTETFIIRWMTMKSYFTCSAPTVNKGQKRNTICNGVLTSRCQAALLEHHVTALSPKLSWISFGKNDTPSCITRGFDKKTIYIHHSNWKVCTQVDIWQILRKQCVSASQCLYWKMTVLCSKGWSSATSKIENELCKRTTEYPSA